MTVRSISMDLIYFPHISYSNFLKSFSLIYRQKILIHFPKLNQSWNDVSFVKYSLNSQAKLGTWPVVQFHTIHPSLQQRHNYIVWYPSLEVNSLRLGDIFNSLLWHPVENMGQNRRHLKMAMAWINTLCKVLSLAWHLKQTPPFPSFLLLHLKKNFL